MFYVEWDLRRSWLSQAENICQTWREEVGTTRYVINRNSNNNNCHTQTHALTAVCHASCELSRTALQMWFHFNYPWREVQTAAATKSLYPSTGLSVMSVCPAVCLADCLSQCLCVRLAVCVSAFAVGQHLSLVLFVLFGCCDTSKRRWQRCVCAISTISTTATHRRTHTHTQIGREPLCWPR